MDAAEGQRLQESVRKQGERIALYEARDAINRKLASVRLPDATKKRILDEAITAAPITDQGELDSAALNTLIESKVQSEAAYLSQLTEGRIVTGMGISTPEAPDPKKAEQQYEESLAEAANVLGFGGKQHEQARLVFMHGRSKFDPDYCARNEEVA